jgi:hypothetical protein
MAGSGDRHGSDDRLRYYGEFQSPLHPPWVLVKDVTRVTSARLCQSGPRWTRSLRTHAPTTWAETGAVRIGQKRMRRQRRRPITKIWCSLKIRVGHEALYHEARCQCPPRQAYQVFVGEIINCASTYCSLRGDRGRTRRLGTRPLISSRLQPPDDHDLLSVAKFVFTGLNNFKTGERTERTA